MKENTGNNSVIAVDLDGTLTLTDTLHESVVALVRDSPLQLFAFPFWLLQGKASLKAKVAEHVKLDVTTLPYNQSLIDWLKKERAAGNKIVLCTATNERIANDVAQHLKLFDEVIASDSVTNIKSRTKRKALEERFGIKGYDYAGNSSADIEVWAGATQAIVVNASSSVKDKAAQVATVSKVFPPQAITRSHWRRVFRVHQWLKNVLIFVPLLAAHRIDDIQSISTLILAFIAFSLCASAVYMANDLLDLDSDRKHPRKRHRPFAAAAVPIYMGAVLTPIFAIASLALGLLVGEAFTAWLVIYFLLTCLYSLWLKRLALIDCLTLAALYTLRIIVGAVSIDLTISIWILAFSIFIFHSLAFLKRYSELIIHKTNGFTQIHGRNYLITDAPLIQSMGIATGCTATVVLSFYLNSDKVRALYTNPEVTMLSIPILLFWINHVWLKAQRGEMHDDPIVFAIKDRISLGVVSLFIAIFLYAI